MTELITLPGENNIVGFETQCLKVPTRHLRRDVLQKVGSYLQSRKESALSGTDLRVKFLKNQKL